MAKSDVKLLGAWTSPFVMRARIALNIKSVDYEYQEENWLVSKSELLLKSNPIHKKVPVLIHADNPICESLIIVQYIDEVWSSGPSILPSDPYDRATSRFWSAYIDDKWFPPMIAFLFAQEEDAKKAAIAQMEESLVPLEEAFGKCSKGKAFFGGDRIGFLDIAFGCFLGWLRVIEKVGGIELLNETKTPSLLKWAERFSSDTAVKELIPDTDKLAEFGKALPEFGKALQAKMRANN
ncbi:hypothetical protein SLEP1_g32583 [Rubroshorea leprosula]|uniref:glutathione transferase n=1 Tax=Rubroshorea leprosula TaxID=152421 RepID=A0AAV5KDU6_9ROSI|nr:hypothetical protein SLEP1_g32583 [Rubroshorea leprosula]